jgi:hypothetical protein
VGASTEKLVHPFPIRSFSINYTMLQADIALKVHGLYNRAFGMLYGFRVKCVDDFTTANDGISAPTAFDSSAIYTGTYGRYQLREILWVSWGCPQYRLRYPHNKKTSIRYCSYSYRWKTGREYN